jgi:hypothetical protein
MRRIASAGIRFSDRLGRAQPFGIGDEPQTAVIFRSASARQISLIQSGLQEDLMQAPTKFLLAGAAALAVAGVAIAADRTHVVNVAMPDGSIAQIHYVGDVVPKVVVAPATDMMPVAFFDQSPFAMFDRISAEMDAHMSMMMHQASALSAATAAAGAQPTEAALKSLPAGTVSYSFTSFSSGNGGACSQSVQVTSLGNNEAPKVVRQNSGDCTAMNSRAPTPAVARPAQAGAPALTPVNLEKPKVPQIKQRASAI